MKWILLITTLLVVAGCGSTQKATTHRQSSHSIATNSLIKSNLMAQHKRWSGTPYQLGGMSRKGIDCSGFVAISYRSLFKVSLPRETKYQAKLGRFIPRQALQSGDLVFFKTGRSLRHVGIYLGGQAFLHASTSRGVMISRLDNPYWNRHYWKAKRFSLIGNSLSN